MARACGPITVIQQKTRVVFQVRVRFAGCYPRKSYLLCAVALPWRYQHRRFVKVESYGPRFHGHQFKVACDTDLDSQVQRWLKQSYGVGAQRYASETVSGEGHGAIRRTRSRKQTERDSVR